MLESENPTFLTHAMSYLGIVVFLRVPHVPSYANSKNGTGSVVITAGVCLTGACKAASAVPAPPDMQHDLQLQHTASTT